MRELCFIYLFIFRSIPSAKFPDHFHQLSLDENRGFSEEYEVHKKIKIFFPLLLLCVPVFVSLLFYFLPFYLFYDGQYLSFMLCYLLRSCSASLLLEQTRHERLLFYLKTKRRIVSITSCHVSLSSDCWTVLLWAQSSSLCQDYWRCTGVKSPVFSY